MIYSTYRKTKTLEPSNVGIENRKTNNFTANSIERIESYASLKRKNKSYRQAIWILTLSLIATLFALCITYFNLIDMRDAYIMHNYTYHYEGRHTTAPPLTWNTWSNVKEGD